MYNPIVHILLNSESMCNSIAHIYVLAAIVEKKDIATI
jgi:hypothetical protein